MRAEVVHEQIVRVVDKEVQSVDHFAIVTDQWHLDGLLNHLRDGQLGTLLLLQKLNLHLLLTFFQKEFSLANDLLTLL